MNSQLQNDVTEIRNFILSFSVAAITLRLLEEKKEKDAILGWSENSRILIFCSSELALGKFIKSKMDINTSLYDINERYFLCHTLEQFKKNKLYFTRTVFFLRKRGLENSRTFTSDCNDIKRINAEVSPDDFLTFFENEISE